MKIHKKLKKYKHFKYITKITVTLSNFVSIFLADLVVKKHVLFLVRPTLLNWNKQKKHEVKNKEYIVCNKLNLGAYRSHNFTALLN